MDEMCKEKKTFTYKFRACQVEFKPFGLQKLKHILRENDGHYFGERIQRQALF